AVLADVGGRRENLLDEVGREVLGAGTRVGDRLLVLVELLRGAERAARAEAVERVRVALQRGEVVEQRRDLALLLLLELGDRPAAGRLRLLDDLCGLVLLDALAADVAAGVVAVAGSGERGLDEPVRLRDE